MNIRDILYQKIEKYFKIKTSQLASLKDLEKISDGTYQLEGPLPINMIKELPYFNNSSGEVAITCIENKWLLTIARSEVIVYPAELNGYIKNGVVQFCAHSHPSEKGHNTGVPSISDLAFKAIDEYDYIIFDKGIVEVDVSSISSINIEAAWYDWIINVLKLTETEFSQADVFSLENEFYNKIGLKMRTISFAEFEDILNSKIKLKSDFWDRESKQVTFPGKIK